MARVELTNRELMDLEKDIRQMADASPAFRFLFMDKISRFYRQNNMILKIFHQKTSSLVKEFCMHGEDEKTILEKQEDGTSNYTFVDDETKANYLAELNEFLGRSSHIEL